MISDRTLRMQLTRLEISGFKSISGEAQIIPFGEITLLLGANGSGKSNILSCLELLRDLAQGRFSDHVGRRGASRLLHYGPSRTDSIRIKASFSANPDSEYKILLKRELPNGLFISSEEIIPGPGQSCAREMTNGRLLRRQAGAAASIERSQIESGSPVRRFLAGMQIYHFDDTSDNSGLRADSYINDARCLLPDGRNLAAFLRMLKSTPEYQPFYKRILMHFRTILRQFGDFEPETLPYGKELVRLDWRDNSDNNFLLDPYQLSDGSLRFLALATALLQPPKFMPTLIALDEPELGLHPAALAILQGTLKIAAQHAQILIATQSAALLDEIGEASLVTVERRGDRSVFHSPDERELKSWLKRYTLSELWEKNVLAAN